MFLFTRVPFWVPILDPQPLLSEMDAYPMLTLHTRALAPAARPTGSPPPPRNSEGTGWKMSGNATSRKSLAFGKGATRRSVLLVGESEKNKEPELPQAPRKNPRYRTNENSRVSHHTPSFWKTVSQILWAKQSDPVGLGALNLQPLGRPGFPQLHTY